MIAIRTIEDANAYIIAAPDKTERERRKAETFHTRYGVGQRGKSYVGKLSNFMIQAQNAECAMAGISDTVVIDEAHYADWITTWAETNSRFVGSDKWIEMCRREGSLIPKLKKRRKLRRLETQRKRRAARNRMAGSW